VRDDTGAAVGRLSELAVALNGARPIVVAAELRAGRRRQWRAPAALVDEAGALILPGSAIVARPPSGSLRLRRDVLDTQVVDLAGRRLTRVGDVILGPAADRLEVVAVEIGRAVVLRRLGLRRLARRSARESIAWEHLHPASGHAHALALDAASSRVHRLADEELQALVERLPVRRGADVLERTAPHRAAGVLAALDPAHRSRLLRALPRPHRTHVSQALAAAPPSAHQRAARHRPRLRRPGGNASA
jgi:hypothetical protein